MKAFEIFIQNNKVSAIDWMDFIVKVLKYERSFTMEIEFTNNNVEFFLYAQKNLSILGSSIEGFVLRPISRKLPIIDAKNQKRVKFKIPLRKNILITRENEKIRKEREINKIIIRFIKIFWFPIYQVNIIFNKSGDEKVLSSYHSLKNPLSSIKFDFEKNTTIKKKSMPLYLKIDQMAKYFSSEKEKGFLEVFGFPDFSHPVYFPLSNFEFGKHSLIVGQSGTGKSKFIELFIKNLPMETLRNEYTIVLIDPHSTLSAQFANEKKFDTINFDFIKSSCDLFPSHSEPKISTELSLLLFKTLIGDQFNAKMERVLKYTIFTLFLRKKMSIKNLKKFLTELEFRKSEIDKLGEKYDYLIHFFESEFIEMQTKFYEISIMPILVLIDELSFLPVFSSINSSNLEECLKNNSLITFSLNRIFLGEKAIRLIAGLIIQQIFLIAQKNVLKKKIILIIDEVSVVENESLSNILAEARKFDLSLFLSQQYLTQIRPELLKGILSNVYNYFVFKMSDEDAKILSQNLDISFPDQILVQQKENGLSEDDLKRNLLVTLNPRECLVRVFAKGKFLSCFKAKTIYLK